MATTENGVTATVTPAEVTPTGDSCFALEITNRGSEDLYINVPEVHGTDYNRIASGETAYYETAPSSNLKKIESFNHKTLSSTTTFDWGVARGNA